MTAQTPRPPSPPIMAAADGALTEHVRNILTATWVYVCAQCETSIEGQPVVYPEHVAAFGYEAAVKFCTDDCAEMYAETNTATYE